METLTSLSIVELPEALLRLLLAALLAMAPGIERDAKRKPIDFRAFAIVAMASCALAILGQEIYADFAAADAFVSIDLAKIVAGVLTGIGFLGAGAIIQRDDGDVVGTATGASIWASGAIGLTIGFGFYALALAMFGLTAIVLIAGAWMARLFARQRD